MGSAGKGDEPIHVVANPGLKAEAALDWLRLALSLDN
jgi:hypothetical protein